MLSYIRRIDLGLVLPILFLGAASLLAIQSAAPRLFTQQLIWFGLGISIFVTLSLVDIRPIFHHRVIVLLFYGASVALLAITAILAPAIRGSRSWIVIGPVQFQTSELAKVGLVVTLSYFFARRHIGIAHISNIFIPFLYFAIPTAFVLLQPDLGSALILGGIFLGYLFISGLRPKHILAGLLLAIVLAVWGWNGFLKPYQKERVLGLFYPERDPLGVNYNVIQSKIAIGSGGFWGKGFKQGTQVQLRFLPEAQTDFIFAVIAEEWGLLGAILVVGALIFLLVRITWIGLIAQQNFTKLIALGTVVVLLLHFTINMGSALGLLPVVGVSFPFLSYGGSNLLINFTLVGIIQSIALSAAF